MRERLIQHAQAGVFAGDMDGGRIAGDEGIKLTRIERGDCIHDVVEAFDLRFWQALHGDGFAGGAGHDADAGMRGVVDLRDHGVAAVTTGEQQADGDEAGRQ